MKCLFAISAIFITVSLAAFWNWIAHSTSFRGSWAQVKAPLVVFDFDGTICPSYPLFIEQVNLLIDEYKLRKVQEDFRDMRPQEIMRALAVSMFRLPFLLRKARRNVQLQLLELQPVPGIVEALQELKRRGYSLGILTSNSPENVLSYLQKYGIDFFDFVYTGNNVFGKAQHLKNILKKGHLHPQQSRVLYVGDEVRDMEAARIAHFKSIGVTWGYNSLKLLQGSYPDFLTGDPSELLSVIDQSLFSSPDHRILNPTSQEP